VPKQTHRKLMIFSPVEWELLHYLARGRPALRVIRDALRVLAAQDRDFDMEAFAKYVTKSVVAKLPERERDQARRQLDELRRAVAGESTPGAGPNIDDDDEIDSSSVFGR
jgi:hypothetical protein